MTKRQRRAKLERAAMMASKLSFRRHRDKRGQWVKTMSGINRMAEIAGLVKPAGPVHVKD